jgi:hypothetical protein
LTLPDAGNKPRSPLPCLQGEFEVTLDLTVACRLSQQQRREPIAAELCERFLSNFRFSGHDQLTSGDLDTQRYIVCYRQTNASLPQPPDGACGSMLRHDHLRITSYVLEVLAVTRPLWQPTLGWNNIAYRRQRYRGRLPTNWCVVEQGYPP